MPDVPLQKRGGKNTSPGPLTLFNGVQGASRIVRLQPRGDNVLVEGRRDAVRIVGIVSMADMGSLLNRNGLGPGPPPAGDVTYTYHFIDANGNEVRLLDPAGGVVSDDNIDLTNLVPTPNPSWGVFGLIEGEKVVLRVTDGDVLAGQGVIFLPTSIHDARNAICERFRIVNANQRYVIAQPPPGKTWQMPVTSSYPCGASMVGMNFDALLHDFDCYLVDDQSNELLLSGGDSVPGGEFANIFTDTVTSHMIPYPYRLEVEVTDVNPIGNLYVATLFAEFDLPKDLG